MSIDLQGIMRVSLLIRKSASYPMYCWYNASKKRLRKNSVLILMYHRILRNRAGDSLVQDGMYVNDKNFEKQLRYLINSYNVVPLETSLNIIKQNEKPDGKKPYCSITFDDGWKDFYENAYNLLKLYRVHATVFLPTDYIGTNNQLWTDVLGMIIPRINDKYRHGYERVVGVNLMKELESLKGSEYIRYEKAIEVLKRYPIEEIDMVIKGLAARWKVSLTSQPRSFLTWEEIKEMFKSGFIQYGSHTKSHRLLTRLSENVMRDELIQSKNRLLDEGIVYKSFLPFAYPNGDHNDRIARLVESAGYSCALTTNKGWNGLGEGNVDVYKLKRIGVHQDMTSTTAMFACRIYGI